MLAAGPWMASNVRQSFFRIVMQPMPKHGAVSVCMETISAVSDWKMTPFQVFPNIVDAYRFWLGKVEQVEQEAESGSVTIILPKFVGRLNSLSELHSL